MFNDTIMQNIRYGRPEATDGEVLGAARMARLDVAVARMTKGYHTSEAGRGAYPPLCPGRTRARAHGGMGRDVLAPLFLDPH